MENLFTQFYEVIRAQGLYIATVLLTASLILLWGLLKLRAILRERVRSAEKMDITAALETELHNKDATRIMRSSAITSIQARFDFIRKIFIPAIVLITLLFIVLPLLPSMSASYVSLTVAILAALTGLAAKPLIENAIAGIVLTISQPIKINDTVVIEGRFGTVEKINALYTVIKIWNWRRYIIPNHQLIQKEFENLSREDEYEWAHVEFFVEPSADMELVKELAKDAMMGEELWSVETPSFWIMDMGKDSVKCWIAGWARSPSEAWDLKAITRRRLIAKLAENKIAFQKVHIQTDQPLSQ